VDDPIYEEKVTSGRTTALFVVLMLLFLWLSAWRATATGIGPLAIVFFCMFCFFLFYALNYRTLVIRITRESLVLTFGIFTWTIRLEDIAECALDDVSLWRIGGAGIHFTWIRRRYRAMFNVLEYPRVVVSLKRRRGLVRDIAFSTRRPYAVMAIIADAAAGKGAA
jgi:hypothetical protein